MKTKILAIILIVGYLVLGHPWLAHSQEVTHTEYTTHYNATLHEPDYVIWTLTAAEFTGTGAQIARTNRFIPDPKIPGTNLARDYDKSGYDQGHQCPAEDNDRSLTGETDCFMFSNMIPQRPKLNRVTWKALEVECRRQAAMGMTLRIVCGGLGSLGTIGPDKVNVPAYCWKVIFTNLPKPNGPGLVAYLMPNQDTVESKPFTAYTIDIKVLDQKLGFDVESLK